MKSMLSRYILQGRTVFLSCALAIFAFMLLRVWSITLLGSEEFREIIKHFKDFEKFSPVPFSQLITYTGRVARTFNEPIVLFVVLIWTISRGSDTVAGQLNRGTMEMLLGNPVSRRCVYWSQFLVTTVGTLALASLAWLAWSSAFTSTPYRRLSSLPLWRSRLSHWKYLYRLPSQLLSKNR